MAPRLAVLALAVLASSSVSAEPPSIPPHVVQQIRMMVQTADAVVLATVRAPSADGGRVELALDQALMGEFPATFRVLPDGFYPADLEPGTKLLLGLRLDGNGDWTGTGRYERVFDGTIRDLPISDYVERTNDEARARTEATLRKEALAQSGSGQSPAAAAATP